MKKSKSEYLKDLEKESIALQQLAFSENIPYDKSREIRKKQNEVHKKYMFMKKLLNAKGKSDDNK